MILWIVGLSGAGKTTLAREVLARWKVRDRATVLVDGDEMRGIFNADKEVGAHSIAGRRQNAERIVALCAWLDRQGINAVCALLSIFPDLMAENRRRFGAYFEVFLDAPLDILEARDSKGLYAGARAGTMRDVVGVDIPFPRPANADMVVRNDAATFPVASVATEILDRIGVR